MLARRGDAASASTGTSVSWNVPQCMPTAASAELHKAVVPNAAPCKAQNASGGGRISVLAGDGQCLALVKFKVDGSYRASDFAFTIFSETPEGTTTWAHTGKRVGTCRW